MKHFVKAAKMRVSANRDDVLVTNALGSCLGIAVHDCQAGVAGLLHVVLPCSEVDRAKAKDNPCLFVDTGVPRLFQACYCEGAKKERLHITVAGGAALNPKFHDVFEIGKRNLLKLHQLLQESGMPIQASDVGSCHSRTLTLFVGTGTVTVECRDREIRL